MKYSVQDVRALAGELRLEQPQNLTGPRERAATMLLELFNEVDKLSRLLDRSQNVCLLFAKENVRLRARLTPPTPPAARELRLGAPAKTGKISTLPPPRARGPDPVTAFIYAMAAVGLGLAAALSYFIRQ